MKKTHVLRRTWKMYRQHFPALMGMLLVQLILRAMALTPLMFLLNESLSFLAWLAVPAYLFIALIARQNVALALQDMLHGGSPFSLRLIGLEGWGRKLGRGLVGTACMLLWSSVTIAGTTVLALAFTGRMKGMDALTLLRTFRSIGQWVGGDTFTGILLSLGTLLATLLLVLIGCAVHCGGRHAAAMGDRRVLRRLRLRLVGVWMLGTLLLLPFVAVVAGTTGGWAMDLIRQFSKTMKLGDIAMSATHLYIILGAVIVLLVPVLPFRTMLPAVYLHAAEENDDAAP